MVEGKKNLLPTVTAYLTMLGELFEIEIIGFAQ